MKRDLGADAPVAPPVHAGNGLGSGADAPVDQPVPPKPAKPIDWEGRAKEAQRDITRRATENARLRAKLAQYEAGDGDESDGEDEAVDSEPAPRPPVSSRFRTAETPRPRVPESEEATELGRSVAEAVHGADVVSDYDRAMQLLAAATTEADRVTAFATFAELRNRAAPPAPRQTSPPGGSQSREQAVTPRVETNRPDAVYPDSEPDPAKFAAGAHGGVGGYFRELFASRRNPR